MTFDGISPDSPRLTPHSVSSARRARRTAVACGPSPLADYGPRMDFTTEELRWISRSLNEVTTGGGPIEDWEFDTRIGGDVDRVRGLLRRINDELAVRREP